MRLDEFMPRQRLKGMDEYLQKFAGSFGIRDFHPRDRIPNTRRALALAEVARDEGKLNPYRQRAMDAHWRDGMDLENDRDLRTIARDSLLPNDAVDRSVSDPQYQRRIAAIRAEANAIGVSGIPTFIIGHIAMSGCQPYEEFEDFARQAGARKRAM